MSNIQVYKFCKCTGHKCKPWLSRHGDNSISGSSVDQKVQIPCLQRIHCIFGLALIFFFFFFLDSVLNHSPKLCTNMKVNSAVTIHGTFMRVCLHYIVYFSIAIFPAIGILANVLLHAIESRGRNFKNMQINQLWKSENQSFYIHGTVLESWCRDTMILWEALIQHLLGLLRIQLYRFGAMLRFVRSFVWCYA